MIVFITNLGNIINGYSFYFFTFIIKKKSSFTILAANVVFSNLIVLAVDALWIPIKMLHLINLPYYLEERVGQIILIGWYNAEFNHLLLSLNRFCAITAPLMYHEIFSNKNTVYFIYGSIFLSICMIIPYSFHDLCTFDHEEYFWVYLETPFCVNASKIQDFWLGVSMSFLIFIIDIITLGIYFVKREKKLSLNKKLQNEGKQIRMIIQTVLANMTLASCCIQFHIIAPYYSGCGFMEFFFTTFQWMGYHAISGIVLGLCYKDLYLHLRKYFVKNKVSKTRIKTCVIVGLNGTNSNSKR
uniref:G_PROTEIN_RECEP_F1_2 domain-containing protein n=1 Tax=Strongyloides venezuelensis TaxID=75913 RepID=A0A0K0FDD1_STRVS